MKSMSLKLDSYTPDDLCNFDVFIYCYEREYRPIVKIRQDKEMPMADFKEATWYINRKDLKRAFSIISGKSRATQSGEMIKRIGKMIP